MAKDVIFSEAPPAREHDIYCMDFSGDIDIFTSDEIDFDRYEKIKEGDLLHKEDIVYTDYDLWVTTALGGIPCPKKGIYFRKKKKANG